MKSRDLCYLLCVATGLSGCGTYVPDLQEFPGSKLDRQQFVAAVVSNVNCELRDAVFSLYNRDKHNFLDGWGIQTTLMLSSVEKSEANPSVNWIPHGTFNMTFGLDASAEATREDSINSFFLVDKIKSGPCSPEARTHGLFLMQSDLRLSELLFDAYTASNTGIATFGGVKDEVLTHHVKFEIDTSGDLTPTYKITRVEVDPSGKLLDFRRNRIQDLIITLGPVEKTEVAQAGKGKNQVVGKVVPSNRAELQHLSYIIGAAVSQGVRSALRP